MDSMTAHVDLCFLTRGTVISIQHPLMFEPSVSVIQKVEGERIFFRIPESFLKNNVLNGDSVTIQFFQDDQEYVLLGMISEVEILYPRNVQVCIDRVMKFRNNRKAKRYIVNMRANLFVPALEKTVYAVIKNVSSTGIGAVFKEQPDLFSLSHVKATIAVSTDQLLEFMAKVVRTVPKGNYQEYGLEITGMDEGNRQRLDQLLLSLEENEKLFIAEYLR